MNADTQQPNSKVHWREFEKLVATLQQKFAPDAKVSTNVKLLGKRTNIERQIDILVEQFFVAIGKLLAFRRFIFDREWQ